MHGLGGQVLGLGLGICGLDSKSAYYVAQVKADPDERLSSIDKIFRYLPVPLLIRCDSPDVTTGYLLVASRTEHAS